MKIYCLDRSELAEHEALNRGFRGDIYVEVENKIFNINIYDIVRLRQDFETELEEYGYFTPEPNLVLVSELTNETIKELIFGLLHQKYFESIKEVSLEELKNKNLMEF